MPIYAFRGAILRAFLQWMRITCHRICDRIFCENPHIAYFSAYINCIFKITYAEIIIIMPHMRKFAYLRTSPHMRCCIFCIFAAYFSALFRQIPCIFPHILHQNGPHILRKISALWSCVWCFFTAGAKSDNPLSHPQYGATQNGLPKIRTGVQVLNTRDSRKSRKHGNHGNRDFRQRP